MAKKINFIDVLTKLTNVFPTDMYLVNNTYAVSGPLSDERNTGYYSCLLNPEIIEVCNSVFDKDKIIYISDIKNGKKALDDYTKEIDNTEEIKTLKDNLKEHLLDKLLLDEWKQFNFSEEDINTLFNTRGTLTLFENDENIPKIDFNKSMIPLVNEKNINELTYNVSKKTDNVYELTISFIFEMFHVIFLYKYIPL